MPTTLRFLLLLIFGLLGLQPVAYTYDAIGFVSLAEQCTYAPTAHNQAAPAESAAPVPLCLDRDRAASCPQANLRPTATFLAAENTGATFGNAASTDYRATFFEANPELEGDVVVHHAVEQQAMTRYPGVVSEAEMHSLENLRGIPNEVNSDLHLSQIRREWNQFYRENATATQQQLLQKATEIDAKYGSQFLPPR